MDEENIIESINEATSPISSQIEVIPESKQVSKQEIINNFTNEIERS